MGSKVYYLEIASARMKFTIISDRDCQHSTTAMSIESHTKYSPFDLTQWTLIQRASDAASPEAHAALDALCRSYWRPLYGYIVRRGYQKHDAQDLTQAFFERLLEKNYLAGVDRRKGKFRS